MNEPFFETSLKVLGAITAIIIFVVAMNAIFGLYYVQKDKYLCTELTLEGECAVYTRREAK